LQELAKHGLPRGCAEHNLLLMMQAQWSARACTWPEWQQTFGRSHLDLSEHLWKFRENPPNPLG
jgi:hypothetical protein